MKICNWCRKLSVTLVAGGLLTPCAAQAANLGTNLVLNPGFESVDPGSPGVYSAVKVLNWVDGSTTGFAYNYGQNYDFGGPLAGGGTYFFTSNQSGGTGADVTAPASVMQIIDVSAGDSAIAIGNGTAMYNLSAFFTSYARGAGTDADIGKIELRFVDALDVGISAVILSDPNPTAGWKQGSTSGSVPAGTAKLYVSLYGEAVVSGPDGYMDNVDLRLIPEPSAGLLASMGAVAMGWLRRFTRRRDN